MGDLSYVTGDSRDDVGYSNDELNSYFNMSDEERATDVSDTTDGSDAYVCEGWDEPNYISADHGYYPDLSEWQSEIDPLQMKKRDWRNVLPPRWNSTFATWIPWTVKRQKCAWPRQGAGASCLMMNWVMIPMIPTIEWFMLKIKTVECKHCLLYILIFLL
jgi:hypothetical protein